MYRGKQTCRILKEIRRQIAEANDIEYATSECQYKGDCLGTCPKCEAEVQYLERQLSARRLAGKSIALAGISVSLIALSSCGNKQQPTLELPLTDTTEQSQNIEITSGANTTLSDKAPTDSDKTANNSDTLERTEFLIVGEINNPDTAYNTSNSVLEELEGELNYVPDKTQIE